MCVCERERLHCFLDYVQLAGLCIQRKSLPERTSILSQNHLSNRTASEDSIARSRMRVCTELGEGRGNEGRGREEEVNFGPFSLKG